LAPEDARGGAKTTVTAQLCEGFNRVFEHPSVFGVNSSAFVPSMAMRPIFNGWLPVFDTLTCPDLVFPGHTLPKSLETGMAVMFGSLVKRAVTVMSLSIVTEQPLEPLQAPPDQEKNLEPAFAAAERLTFAAAW
jgi:hypothetical protein